MIKELQNLEEKYDLEIAKIIAEIKKQQAELIVLQFPDALKLYATQIAEEIENKTNCQCLIWMASCFGACDMPLQVEQLKPKIDMIIQFGHNKFGFEKL